MTSNQRPRAMLEMEEDNDNITTKQTRRPLLEMDERTDHVHATTTSDGTDTGSDRRATADPKDAKGQGSDGEQGSDREQGQDSDGDVPVSKQKIELRRKERELQEYIKQNKKEIARELATSAAASEDYDKGIRELNDLPLDPTEREQPAPATPRSGKRSWSPESDVEKPSSKSQSKRPKIEEPEDDDEAEEEEMLTSVANRGTSNDGTPPPKKRRAAPAPRLDTSGKNVRRRPKTDLSHLNSEQIDERDRVIREGQDMHKRVVTNFLTLDPDGEGLDQLEVARINKKGKKELKRFDTKAKTVIKRPNMPYVYLIDLQMKYLDTGKGQKLLDAYIWARNDHGTMNPDLVYLDCAKAMNEPSRIVPPPNPEVEALKAELAATKKELKESNKSKDGINALLHQRGIELDNMKKNFKGSFAVYDVGDRYNDNPYVEPTEEERRKQAEENERLKNEPPAAPSPPTYASQGTQTAIVSRRLRAWVQKKQALKKEKRKNELIAAHQKAKELANAERERQMREADEELERQLEELG